MTHKRLFLTALAACAGVMIAIAQAKKPTLMVIPAEAWCHENGYMSQTTVQGDEIVTPDYEKAYRENTDLLNATTKVGELMAERGFPLKDLSATIRDVRRSAAEDEMTASRTSGASIAETPLEKIMARAKADILREIAWTVNNTGPKHSLTYTLRGIDAYTNKQIAAAQGTGTPSFSAEIPVLIEEAVLEHMDAFIAQLQNHFYDIAENGREINVNVRIFDNGSDLSFEDEFDGEELTDIIDSWMHENTVKHRYSMSDAGETRLSFEQVRIPLYTDKGRAMDARTFATALRRYLSGEPCNITSKIITKGLGRVDIILGEK